MTFLPWSSLATAPTTLPKSQTSKALTGRMKNHQLWDHLGNLKMCKFIGPDEVRPRVTRELAAEVAKPLSVIFEKLWQSGEVPTDWKSRNIT